MRRPITQAGTQGAIGAIANGHFAPLERYCSCRTADDVGTALLLLVVIRGIEKGKALNLASTVERVTIYS